MLMKRTGSESRLPWIFLWEEWKVPCGSAALCLFYFVLLHEGAGFLSPAFFILLLAGAAAEDGFTGYISDIWSILLTVLGLLTAFMTGDVLLSASSGLLAAVIYTILYFLSKKSMGTGDIFLSAGAACWLNPVTCLLFIWFSALSALLFSAFFLITGKWNRKSPVRFGPFMALGGILAYGMEIWLPLPPGLPFG